MGNMGEIKKMHQVTMLCRLIQGYRSKHKNQTRLLALGIEKAAKFPNDVAY